MSWKATVYVSELLQCPDGTPLTRDSKLLLFLLADHHNVSDEESRPSIITLAKEALMSERHTRDLLRWLERHGVLECTPGNGRGHTSSYCFVELKKAANMVPPLFPERGQKGGTKGAQPRIANKEELVSKNPFSLAEPERKEQSLHYRVRKYIESVYEKRFNIPPSWDGSEARLLKGAIEANPTWIFTTFQRLIDNRYASDGVNGERPRVWIGDLAKYMDGPLNEFNRPKNPPPLRSGSKPKSPSQLMREQLEA